MCAVRDNASGELLNQRPETVSVYIEAALKARLEQLARENERSLSAQIRWMLGRLLDEREAA